uniref:NAC domain-containing protein n=1 Tax=Tanacetum cinerariifolium TaxID=118510 RepID=A0A6L2JNX0_TANCI|nr:NAC domain-containing protein [Tanacetum cinerariifolium]
MEHTIYDQSPCHNQDFGYANLYFIHQVSNISLTVVRSVEVPIIALIVKPGTRLSMSIPLSTLNSMRRDFGTYILEPIVNSIVYKERDDDIKVTLYEDYMEPTDTLLMGDKVISTITIREIDKLIKFSVDDLVSIPKEPKVTSDSNFECDMPTPLPTTDVRKEDFDINSSLGEQVVNFLMENEDVASFPRHLVKRLFSHLVKKLSSTKRMSDEPLGDDSKPRSYDVTFSNPLFDFNDEFTLCNDNPLFDEEFEDISILDPPKLTPLNYEPFGNPNSVSRSLETSDLNLEELTAEIGLDDSIPTEIDDGYCNAPLRKEDVMS